MFLLDTTFLIDLSRGAKDPVEFLERHSFDKFCTTEVNIFEFVTGFFAVGKTETEARTRLSTFINRLIVFPLDRIGALSAGKINAELLKKGQRIEESDCMIAGIALSNGVTKIVTNNKDHFMRISGIAVVTY